jgi:predicted DNA-binding antitoxin AbrB/MazE fold protein
MTAAVTAIVENGLLRPDQPLPFPDHTRVKLTIETVESENESLAAWNRLLARLDQHPMAGLAATFSRDELHERD